MQLKPNKMESKIIKKQKNPFLNREEYIIEFVSGTNPSFKDVEEVIGGDAGLIAVKKINNNFGRRIFSAEAFVYFSKEDKAKIETVSKKMKSKEQEKKEAPAEQPKEEKSVEQPLDEGKLSVKKPEVSYDGN